MLDATIYTDPFTGREILLLEDDGRLFGATYDPLRAGTPLAFTRGCRHCEDGRRVEISIHVRREIMMLVGRRSRSFIPGSRSLVREYRVHTRLKPHVLRCWTFGKKQHARVLDEKREVLRASRAPREETTYLSENKTSDLQIVRRAISFLFSARTATPAEIEACALPLSEAQEASSRRRGFRQVCHKIDWTNVLRRARSEV